MKTDEEETLRRRLHPQALEVLRTSFIWLFLAAWRLHRNLKTQHRVSRPRKGWPGNAMSLDFCTARGRSCLGSRFAPLWPLTVHVPRAVALSVGLQQRCGYVVSLWILYRGFCHPVQSRRCISSYTELAGHSLGRCVDTSHQEKTVTY